MTPQEKLLATAQAEIGYLEKASNKDLDDKTANAGKNNWTKYARDLDNMGSIYNGKKNGYDWCDVFVDWCFITTFGEALGMDLLCQAYQGLGAGVKYSANYYKKNGQFHAGSPRPGDQIFFYGSDISTLSHTGIVEKVDGGMVYTVEGNTSGASGVVSNGGGVARKSYALTYSRIAGYGRPDWTLVWDEPKKKGYCTVDIKALKKGAKGEDVRALQYLLIGNGFSCGSCGADGSFGGATDTALRAYQEARGLAVDGSCGGNTWRRLLGVG